MTDIQITKKRSKYVQVRTHCVRTSEDIGTDSFSNSGETIDANLESGVLEHIL